MDFTLSDEHRMLQQSVREFAQQQIAPRSAAWDEAATFPPELIELLRPLGLWGLSIPEEYGGSGADALSFSLVTTELSRVDGSTGLTFFLQNGITGRSIVRFGTEEQKRRFLPKMATGEWLGGWGMTEPSAGSDAPAMRTTALLQGDSYVLNGQKAFCSLGSKAEVFVVQAKTDPSKRAEGISFFIVPRGTPGFTVGRDERKLGMRSCPLTELVFEDCRIPRENLLLAAPDAFRQMMNLFNTERVGNSSCSLGIAQGALEMAMRYTGQREAMGQRVSDFQGIRWMLADMATQIECARLLIMQTVSRVDRGERVIREASMMKIYANEMVQRVTNDALQMFGAYGFTKDAGIEQKYRDARGLAIAGGTPQVLRNTLAREILSRPAGG